MPKYTLTDAQVYEFRVRRVVNGEYLEDLCKEYGITKGYGYRLSVGDFRAKAGGPLEEPYHRRPTRNGKCGWKAAGKRNPRSILLPEDEDLAVKLITEGKARYQSVADVMGVSLSCIKHLMSRHRKAQNNG